MSGSQSNTCWADDLACFSPMREAQLSDEEVFSGFANMLFETYMPNANPKVLTKTTFYDSQNALHEVSIQSPETRQVGEGASNETIAATIVPMVDTQVVPSMELTQQYEVLVNALPGESSDNSRKATRDPSLLAPLIEKAGKMQNPSVRISRHQLVTPTTRRDEEVKGNPLLRTHVDEFIDGFVSELETADFFSVGKGKNIGSSPYENLRVNMLKRAQEGQYTCHNRADLSKRWENYVQERIQEFTGIESAAIHCATVILQKMLDISGATVCAQELLSYGPEQILERCNPGNANDYKVFSGIKKRTDPEMVNIGLTMFQRLIQMSDAISAGMVVTKSDVYKESICTSFGKTEVVGSTVGADGGRVKKNCRAIFPTSPVDYFKKTFLFYDLAQELKERFPCYGPGFAAGRAHDKKVVDLLKHALDGGKPTTRESAYAEGRPIRIINRDMKHWDTRMSEAAILTTLEILESRVNKNSLSQREKNIRSLVYDVAADEVLTKLVEHPSGYLMWVSGTLPSGTYVTSLLNSMCNVLLCIACPIYLSMKYGKKLWAQDDILTHAGELAEIALRSIICNGDNQMGTDELYNFFGLSFSPERDDEFFSAIGMKVKIDECGDTTRLDQCMFSQRKFVSLKGELYPTRCVDSLLKKMYAKPFTSALDAKLYVRCMMVDYLAIDPLIFKLLKSIDSSLYVPPQDLFNHLSSAGENYKEFIMNSFGREKMDQVQWDEIVAELCRASPSRPCILSLLLPTNERPVSDDKEAAARGFIVGSGGDDVDKVMKYLLTSQCKKTIGDLSKISVRDWLRVLKTTGQTEIFFEMDETLSMISQ